MATCGCLAGSAKDFYIWTNWTGPVPVPRPAQIGSSFLFPNPSVPLSLHSVFRLRHRPPRSPRHPSDVPTLLNKRITSHRCPDAVHPTSPTPLAPLEEAGHRGGVLDRRRRAHALPAVQHSSRSSFCLCLTCSRPCCAPSVIVSDDRGSKSSRLMHICGIPPLRADGSDYQGAPRSSASRLSMSAYIQLLAFFARARYLCEVCLLRHRARALLSTLISRDPPQDLCHRVR